ncbi:probable O-methyltransferase 3 [Actinidia eriantha]|uniref:probable O-methyltransferase 3 n=1 Tax=Actinidia eriantha TaxID=165200 RepID=UPI002583E63A|nr:probable O-methyltransferase 3 [Actinidia eriantha]
MEKCSSDEQGRELLLQSQAHIWNHIFNFINSMSLKCAIELVLGSNIPDIVNNHGRPMTLSELVAALPINPSKSRCVYRLMRILVHSGFFTKEKVSKNGEDEEEEHGGYLLTPPSRLLLKDEPFSVAPFLLAMLDPTLTKPWHFVSEWFKNHDPTTFDTAHGRTLWDYVVHEPRMNHFFNEAMASDSRLVTSVLVKDCKAIFEGLNSLVDVGGGTGTVAKAIAEAFPNLECIVLDLPHVVADLQGSCKNLTYVGGDMLEAIPSADAVLLKWILHDWSDEESVKILKRCKEAIPSRGKVIIIDMKVENQKGDDHDQSIETQLFFDMLMMTLTTGRERTEKEWAKLFSDAGFSDYKIVPILGLRSLIEVYP